MPMIDSRVLRAVGAAAILSLLAALWLGLMRLPWSLPALPTVSALSHGPLMVGGFLGTLIAMERVAALRRAWMMASPALAALGAVSLLLGAPPFLGALFITLGSIGLAAIFGVMLRQHPTDHVAVMFVGTLAWVIGNALWLAGWAIPQVVLWWLGFLVLTIAGERLELNRVLKLSGAIRLLFIIVVMVFLAGLGLSAVTPDLGVRVAGAGLIGLAAWLVRFDIARYTIRREGLTRYIAACLLAGYVWLGVGGALIAGFGHQTAGLRYDAMLHSVFLGFVFSMIFGHAPMILPALTGREMAYSPRFYAHLALLHASLMLRVGGDLAGWLPGRQWGGLLNMVALLAFVGSAAYTMLAKQRE